MKSDGLVGLHFQRFCLIDQLQCRWRQALDRGLGKVRDPAFQSRHDRRGKIGVAICREQLGPLERNQLGAIGRHCEKRGPVVVRLQRQRQTALLDPQDVTPQGAGPACDRHQQEDVERTGQDQPARAAAGKRERIVGALMLDLFLQPQSAGDAVCRFRAGLDRRLQAALAEQEVKLAHCMATSSAYRPSLAINSSRRDDGMRRA